MRKKAIQRKRKMKEAPSVKVTLTQRRSLAHLLCMIVFFSLNACSAQVLLSDDYANTTRNSSSEADRTIDLGQSPDTDFDGNISGNATTQDSESNTNAPEWIADDSNDVGEANDSYEVLLGDAESSENEIPEMSVPNVHLDCVDSPTCGLSTPGCEWDDASSCVVCNQVNGGFQSFCDEVESLCFESVREDGSSCSTCETENGNTLFDNCLLNTTPQDSIPLIVVDSGLGLDGGTCSFGVADEGESSVSSCIFPPPQSQSANILTSTNSECVLERVNGRDWVSCLPSLEVPLECSLFEGVNQGERCRACFYDEGRRDVQIACEAGVFEEADAHLLTHSINADFESLWRPLESGFDKTLPLIAGGNQRYRFSCQDNVNRAGVLCRTCVDSFGMLLGQKCERELTAMPSCESGMLEGQMCTLCSSGIGESPSLECDTVETIVSAPTCSLEVADDTCLICDSDVLCL